jgi:hypothetical protein
MARLDCPEEVAVSKAVRNGGLDTLLEAHVAGCEVCRGIVAASVYMQGVAKVSSSDAALPDAGLLYWRARLSEDAARAEKASHVLDWVSIAPVAVVIGVAGWIVWHWFVILGAIELLVSGTRLGGASGSTLIVGLSVVAVLGLLAVMVAYPGWVDEL